MTDDSASHKAKMDALFAEALEPEGRPGRPKNDDRARARAAGEKTYVGLECSRGHEGGVRYVVNKVCVQCAKEAGKKSRDRKKRTNY